MIRSNVISFFIKGVKIKGKKKNNRVLFSVEENAKNIDDDNAMDKIYKRKGINQKLVKGSLKKNNKYINSSENLSDTISFHSNENFNNNSEKKDSHKRNGNSSYKLRFDNSSEMNYSNDEREIHNTSYNRSETRKDSVDDYIMRNYKRRERKGYTTGYRRIKDLEDMYEDIPKSVGKVKYKKAKIRKFKSHRDNFDEDSVRMPRGYLHDYIHGKKNPFIDKEDNNQNKKRSKSSRHLQKLETKEIRGNSKNHKNKQIINNENYNYDIFNKNSYYKLSDPKKDFRALSATKNQKKVKITKNENKNNKFNNNKKFITNTSNIDRKAKNRSMFSLNRQVPNIFNKKKIISDNIDSKIHIPKLKKSEFKSIQNLRSKSSDNKKSNTSRVRKEPNKLKLKISREMLGIDAVKSKFKKKLIEMNDDLLDAIYYYNGPIDISCISSKKYIESVNELKKKVLKNGFKCIKSETNYFKFSNGLDSFVVEIVKIRNNMLYYLILKNQ